MQDPTDAHCRDLLPWYAANLLDAAEQAHVARHLASCVACQQELAQWQAIGAGANRRLQRRAPRVTTAASWERLQSSLSAPLNGKHTATKGNTYMEFDQQSTPSATIATTYYRRPSILALAAVSLVVILGIVGFAFFTSHTPAKSQIGGSGTLTGTSAPSNGAIPPIYLTPATLVTPAPGNTMPISDVQTSTMAQSAGGQLKLPPPTALFHVGDAINVSMKVQGAKANDIISIKWYMNNTDLTPSLKQINAECCSKTMADDKANGVIFTLQVPTPGLGKAEIYFNGALADTVLFDVVTPAQLGTPTPTAGT